MKNLCFTLGTVVLCSQVWASDDAMACVKDIAIPSAYSTIVSKIPAIVEARILIGAHGKAERITYDTNVKFLTLRLDGYFKEKRPTWSPAMDARLP